MKRTVSGIMLILFLLGSFGLVFVYPVKASSGTIYIRANGSIDPPTAPITTVDKITYTLTGTITSDADGIVIERGNIVLDGAGYTLQGSGTGNGIDFSGRRNVTVRNMQIEAFVFGIWLGSNNNSVIGNSITDNSIGIELYYSSNNNIVGNNITNNGDGIWLQGSSGNNVVGNNITNNVDAGIGLDHSSSNSVVENNITNSYWGMMLESSSKNNVIGNTFTNDGLYVWDSHVNSVENNTVNGKPLVYLEGVTGYSVGDAGQVILVRCDDIRVESLNLSRTSIGLQLLETNKTIISGNNITANNVYSIWLDASSDNSISGNNIGGTWTGISLFSFSNHNSISGNDLTNSDTGIWLDSSSNTSINGNKIIANNYYGILLYSSSNNNSVIGNNIINNGEGTYLGGSSNNKLYHNNFIGNGVQVYVENSTNVWDDDYPSGGNYWSDYAGVDTNHDGIGDTPYLIDSNNQDRYPLMYSWSSLPVHNMNTGLGYATIQQAINANETLDGHIIFVEAGTYYEHVVVNKSLSLIGANRETTIIDANGTYSATAIELRASGTKISGFTVQRSYYGIYLNNVNYCSITESSITTSYYAIRLEWSSTNVISKNNVTNTEDGINLYWSLNNVISENNLTTNINDGISLQWSIYNVISKNNIANNRIEGIHLDDSLNNSICGNNIKNNGLYGIAIYASSFNNTIFGNNIAENGYHVPLVTSLKGYGIWLSDSSNNTIYHNNFLNNSNQVFILNRANCWDNSYPSGGNYWSNLVSVDVKKGPNQDLPGSDGLGDSPYVIDASNRDNYPLMSPYGTTSPPSYTLTITATVGGTTSPAPGAYGYTVNSQVQIAAVPNTGYVFNHWELDGVNVGSANPYTVLMDKNHTLRAVFLPTTPPPPVGGIALRARTLAVSPASFYLAAIAIMAAVFMVIKPKRRNWKL